MLTFMFRVNASQPRLADPGCLVLQTITTPPVRPGTS